MARRRYSTKPGDAETLKIDWYQRTLWSRLVKSSRRLMIPVVAVAVLGVGAPAFAVDGGGGSSTITATLTAAAIGSRSVTAVSPVTLTSALNSSVATGALAVTVTEAARSGTNSWSLTATASDLSDGAATPHTIPASNLSVLARSVVQAGGGGTAAAPAGTSPLDSAATLFATTGQDTGLLYTGTYAAAGTVSLAIPNGAPSGAYTGTLTVSLI